MKIKHITLIILFLFAIRAMAATYFVPPSVTWLKQKNGLGAGNPEIKNNVMYINAQPGDSIVFEAGRRGPLRVDSIKGNSIKPVVFVNPLKEKVILTQPDKGYYGLSFNYCRYIKISGKNGLSDDYGIQITEIPAGAGLSINNFSSDFEVERLEISKIYSAGIVCKTDPSCENKKEYSDFVMRDVSFHHNYLHHIGNEGFYIGHTGYNNGKGVKLKCDGGNILPHNIIGVKVYNNIVDSTGWDGIQVSSAGDFEIFNNRIYYDSYANYPNQQSGIMIGQLAIGKVYNNTIKNSKGIGIQCLGVGVNIFNNLIIRPGNFVLGKDNFNSDKATTVYGIYINDKVCIDSTVLRLPYFVVHNTIIIQTLSGANYTYTGISLNSLAYIKGSEIGNNLIVINDEFNSPVNGSYNAIVSVGGNLFISADTNKTHIGINYFSNIISAVGFENPENDDFRLDKNSPAKNSPDTIYLNGVPLVKYDTDENNWKSDFGCYELGVTK